MPITITDAGVQVQTQDQILAELNAAFVAEFGADFTLTDDSFTYRQNAIWSTREATLQSLVASAISAADIERATGRQLDYIGSLFNRPRKGASRSTITALVTGTPNTPVGDKRVRYVLTGDIWRTPIGAVIGPDGTVSVTLSCDTTGPVFATAQGSTAWVIVDVTTGLLRVESTADAQRGRTLELDPEYRARLLLVRSSNAGTEPAVRAAIAGIDGVSTYFYDNNRSAATNSNGVPPWSAEAIINGGADETIGETLYNVYGGSTGFFGNTSINVTDPTDGSVTLVKWSRVLNYQVVGEFVLQLSGDTPLPLDGETIAINAIADRINTNGAGIDVDPGDLIAAAAIALPPGVIEPDDSTGEVAFKGGTLQTTPLVFTHRENAFALTVPQPVTVQGTTAGPFNITSGSHLDLSIGDGELVVIPFSTDDFVAISAATITEVIAVLSAALPETALAGSANGSLVITSVDTGLEATITIGATSTPGLLTALGLVAGVYYGTAPDIIVTFAGP